MNDSDLDQVAMLLNDEVVCAPPAITLRQAASMMREAEIGLLVVGQPDDVVGVISERDIVTAVAAGRDLDAVSIGVVASDVLKWATPDSTVSEVIEQMMSGYLRHVLVGGEGGRLVGIVSMRDLLGAYPG